MSRHGILAALALLVALTPALAGPETFEVEGQVKSLTLRNQATLPFGPERLPVTFPDGGVEGLAAPEGLTDVATGTVEIAGETVSLLVGKSSADKVGRDVLGLDLSGDGNIGEDERVALEVSQGRNRGGQLVTQGLNLDFVVKNGGREVRLAFACGQAEGGPLGGQILPVGYLQGQFEMGGKTLDVYVYDADATGNFDSSGDLWMVEVPGSRTRPASAYSLATFDRGFFAEGHRFTLGTKVTTIVLQATPADGPNAEDMVAARERVEHIWASRFDAEREKFIEARGVDTSRPKAETPIAWRYVTLDEAKAMAAKEGKPLFVDVMAFWCVWCYRMDYYTYPDAEVAKLLSEKFVPVKIIQEQDTAGDYPKIMAELGARGIPAMGVWAPDGKLLSYISGWNKPADFVSKLNEALSKLGGE
jgi:hypothetical protein